MVHVITLQIRHLNIKITPWCSLWKLRYLNHSNSVCFSSYSQISWKLGTVRIRFRINFPIIWKFSRQLCNYLHLIWQLWDFARCYDKMSIHFVNVGPVSVGSTCTPSTSCPGLLSASHAPNLCSYRSTNTCCHRLRNYLTLWKNTSWRSSMMPGHRCLSVISPHLTR